MAFSNKLYKEIHKLQTDSGYDFFLDGNTKSETYVIISITKEAYDSTHPIGCLKATSLDLVTGKLHYTLTKNLSEATKFSNEISSMLYHNIEHFAPEFIGKHHHNPILIKRKTS